MDEFADSYAFMKKSCLLALVPVIAIPVLGQLSKDGSQRKAPPKGWTKFEWAQKKDILLKYFAPTTEELAAIDKALPTKLSVEPKNPRRILLFYKCDYPHSSIATGIAAFEKMGQATKAFAVDSTDDPEKFSAQNLAQYDAILLNNSVGYETFLNETQRQALLDFVKSGKGLIGIHAAADACKEWKPGADLMGGVFECHPWTSKGTWALKVESPLHPLNTAFDETGDFINDEIYHYRNGSFSTDRSRVLLSLDMEQPRNFLGSGLQQKNAGVIAKENDYPVAWLHQHGKGRVFYSNLGHNHSTYWNPKVLQHYLDGIQYALGDLEADATPSGKLSLITIAPAPAKRIVFLAGRPSHKSGDHEFRAGCLLLAKALNTQSDLPVKAEVISGWPKDDTVLDDAAALVIYCDSDSVHREQYKRLMELHEEGSGIFFMHYGVHPKKPEDGKNYYLPTVGGFMESGFSVNPKWAADLNATSDHPVRRGCEEPVPVYDEWYYSLRFAKNVIPLVTAIPTKDNMVAGSNLWNENATMNYGKPQNLVWGFENFDGTRGGGFTGGHYHRNWTIDGYRKMILNTIAWIAGMDVPEGGVKSEKITEEQINANLDQKKNMTHIKLPLKTAMDYRLAELRSRAERKRAAKGKTEAPKPMVKEKPKSGSIDEPLIITPWRLLLDEDLTQWEKWLGVPGEDHSPLGLNNDALKVFSVIEENGKPVLKISGQIDGALTTKKEYENYHLSLQCKWGDKKWPPHLDSKRASGLLLHSVGKHGASQNAWKQSLEYKIKEGDLGYFDSIAGARAYVANVIKPDLKNPTVDPRSIKPHGEWNTIEIYTIEDTMVYAVNGTPTIVLHDTREKTAFGLTPLTKGQIQLQSEGSEIFFRDIKIRDLPEFPPAIKTGVASSAHE